MGKPLGPAQIELLHFTALGMDYNEIAAEIQQEPEYVRWLLRSAREALGAKRMPQAVAIAYERGILPVNNTEKEKVDG